MILDYLITLVSMTVFFVVPVAILYGVMKLVALASGNSVGIRNPFYIIKELEQPIRASSNRAGSLNEVTPEQWNKVKF